MGNKPPARQKRNEIVVRPLPALDRAFVKWLARDVRRLHDFAPRDPRAIKPPDHYIEYMQLYGWLDLDMNDPDLAHLIKSYMFKDSWGKAMASVGPTAPTIIVRDGSSVQDLALSALTAQL